jgi:hypothetical protein
MSGGKVLEQIKMTLRSNDGELLPVYIDVYDNSLAWKWLDALNDILNRNLHLEKNYCFFGFADGDRNGEQLVKEINDVIDYINQSDINYEIEDHFTLENSLDPDNDYKVNHDHFNMLHRYFEDLEGTAQNPSPHAQRATPEQKWYIRQTNLLCHEFESWALSNTKKNVQDKYEWMRPSQVMCWINSPRFELTEEDFEFFGIDALVKDFGGIYLGVNKAVGKHHYEVFVDEGDQSRIDTLTTTTMRGQTLAAGDFDVEWGQGTRRYEFKQAELQRFREWLIANGFDPEDKSLTIGHPKVGQIDLLKTFGTEDMFAIWETLYKYLDVYSIQTSTAEAVFEYRWSDPDFVERQVKAIGTH